MISLHETSEGHHSSPQARPDQISQGMQQLLDEEKAAMARVEKAGEKAEAIIAAARAKAAELISEAHSKAAEEKSAIVAKAEAHMLGEAKRIVEDAEKRATKMRAKASKGIDAAASKLLGKLLE